ncbi:MAG: 1-acyl-sn-glycerol-3-phosphate acyltransferase [Archangium sp.]|nr:1-acyl-sn-glycerol-3-phosphate acyltransferase [Archangium sp.]
MRNIFCVFVAAFWSGVCFVLAALAIAVTLNPSRSLYVVQRVWSPVLLWAGGAKLEISGLEHLQVGKPYVFVSNHQSTIDIPALFVALPVDFRFAAKRSLKYVPFIGWYMTLAKFIYVDRANHPNALASLDIAGKQIRGGISVVMFCEGTRSEDLRILPFKKGPFALALNAGVGVVPITIEGSGRLMPKNSWNITPGPIRVRIGAPIDPAPFGTDLERLLRATRDIIIDQSLALGGKGGDRDTAVAAKGLLGRAAGETS